MYDAGVQQIAHRVVRQHNVIRVIHVLLSKKMYDVGVQQIAHVIHVLSERKDRCTTLVCNKLHTVLCVNTT